MAEAQTILFGSSKEGNARCGFTQSKLCYFGMMVLGHAICIHVLQMCSSILSQTEMQTANVHIGYRVMWNLLKLKYVKRYESWLEVYTSSY